MKLSHLSPEQKLMLNRRHSTIAHIFKSLYIIVELLIVNISFIASLYILYDRRIETFGMTHFFRKNNTDVVASAFQFVFLITVTSAAIPYAFQYYLFSRWSIVLGSVLMMLLTSLWSILCLKISKAIYSKSKLLIIASTPEDADRLYLKVRTGQKTLHIKYLGYTLADDLPRVFNLDMTFNICI